MNLNSIANVGSIGSVGGSDNKIIMIIKRTKTTTQTTVEIIIQAIILLVVAVGPLAIVTVITHGPTRRVIRRARQVQDSQVQVVDQGLVKVIKQKSQKLKNLLTKK
jgi:hypothetical protein